MGRTRNFFDNQNDLPVAFLNRCLLTPLRVCSNVASSLSMGVCSFHVLLSVCFSVGLCTTSPRPERISTIIPPAMELMINALDKPVRVGGENAS